MVYRKLLFINDLRLFCRKRASSIQKIRGGRIPVFGLLHDNPVRKSLPAFDGARSGPFRTSASSRGTDFQSVTAGLLSSRTRSRSRESLPPGLTLAGPSNPFRNPRHRSPDLHLRPSTDFQSVAAGLPLENHRRLGRKRRRDGQRWVRAPRVAHPFHPVPCIRPLHPSHGATHHSPPAHSLKGNPGCVGHTSARVLTPPRSPGGSLCDPLPRAPPVPSPRHPLRLWPVGRGDVFRGDAGSCWSGRGPTLHRPP